MPDLIVFGLGLIKKYYIDVIAKYILPKSIPLLPRPLHRAARFF